MEAKKVLEVTTSLDVKFFEVMQAESVQPQQPKPKSDEPEQINSDPQNMEIQQKAKDRLLYAQVEATLKKEEYEAIMGSEKIDQQAQNPQGRHFIIFNDKSGSMSGTPFNALKEACLGIKDHLFADGGKFETVEVCFYDNNVKVQSAKSADQYQ